MKNRKIMFSNGFASDVANCEMQKLSDKAKIGWRLKKVSNSALFYILEKSEPADLIYSFDYVKLKKEEISDYLDLFEKSGWSYINSSNNFHFFCAPIGTPPIVSEQSTRCYQYRKLSKIMLIAGIQYTFLSIIFFILTKAFKYYAFNILRGITAALFGIFLAMMLLGFISSIVYYRISRKHNKKI